MKKTFIYTILLLFVAGLMSCGDNTGFSTLHNMTDDEVAEIARQDSIAAAEKASRITSYNVCYTKLLRAYYGSHHFD